MVDEMNMITMCRFDCNDVKIDLALFCLGEQKYVEQNGVWST